MVPNGSGINVSGVNAPPKLVKVIMASRTEQVNGYVVNGGGVAVFKQYDDVATRLVSGVNRFTITTDSKEITVQARLAGSSEFTVSSNGIIDVVSVLAGSSSFQVNSDGELTVNALLGSTEARLELITIGKVNSVTFSDVVGNDAYVVDPVNIVFQVDGGQEFNV